MVAANVFSIQVSITPGTGNFTCSHTMETGSEGEIEFKF